jgi:hypothetical protein
MSPEVELRRLAGEAGGEPPAGYLVDELTFPGGEAVLTRALEVMTAVVGGAELPDWFKAQCIDDRAIQTCELKKWSLRAWKYWFQPENRRWWWWSAAVAGGELRLTILVRARPYLRGSLDWLFTASATAH